jgi:hypothetical protein
MFLTVIDAFHHKMAVSPVRNRSYYNEKIKFLLSLYKPMSVNFPDR